MPDSDIHELLVAYTADEPPLTFGLDDVRDAGRRVRRRRRVAVAVGAGTAVAAVVAGVALTAPSDHRAPVPHTVAGPFWAVLDPAPYCAAASAPPTGPTIAPTVVPNEKNGYRIRIPTEPAEHAAARISCYLAAAVPPLLPGADFHREPTTPAGTVPLEAYPARVFDPARPGDTTPPVVGASAVITDDQGVGDIGFSVSPAYESAADATASCTALICAVRTGPHGETIMIVDVREESGYRLVNLYVYRGDDIVFASASNGIPQAPPSTNEAGTTADQRPGRADLPLSVDDLIRIATAPQLTLFPNG